MVPGAALDTGHSLRSSPRQLPMNELLAGVNNKNVPDPARRSLVDADMGAFYAWINQQRLMGSAQALFVAWFQEYNQAMVAGPGFPSGDGRPESSRS
jgi:hypothetical protein